MDSSNSRREEPNIDDYVAGVLARDPAMLARTVTLIESSAPRHQEKAQRVLGHILSQDFRPSIRIGITGVPGAGKSTFIDTFGTMLCDQGHHLAVLAIDPSSSLSRGSILGDKTRMENLTRHKNCFIRPSPSGGTLGGVARKTRETILVCEAAGYDVVIVETVGVGQTEITVRGLVDFFLLLTITGAGDELQTFKKGIVEIADALVVNKCDGDNIHRAQALRADFEQVLRYLAPFTKGWEIGAYTCSALSGDGMKELWELISRFRRETARSGEFDRRRREQLLSWFDEMVLEGLKAMFFAHPEVNQTMMKMKEQVLRGTLPVAKAAESVLAAYERGKES